MIHTFENNGYRLCLDVDSGSVHTLDGISFDVLKELESGASGEEVREHLSVKWPEAEIGEVLQECEELRRSGSLFAQDAYRPSVEAFANRPTVVKALCLHIAHDCNLACRYCFAGEGEYHGRRALMSVSTGKAALDFLIRSSGSRRNLEVDFFGGEPTMNWETVKELVVYGREQEALHDKHFRFTLTTNGVLLNDEIMDLCNREMDNVVLSLDGRREINDRMRPYRGGTGSSYDRIVPKLRKFAESRNQEKYYVRGTFTRYNLDFAADVLHMADLGFRQISVEPVVAPQTEEYAIREEDLPQICEQYDILAKEMLRRRREGRGFQFFHFMIDLSGGPCVYKRLSGCGAGGEYLAVTPWGDLYPCHQFVGMEDFCLGNVTEGLTREDISREFRSVNVYSRPECAECFARYFCSGGCMANSYHASGRIDGSYSIGCVMQRKRVECALMLYSQSRREEPK